MASMLTGYDMGARLKRLKEQGYSAAADMLLILMDTEALPEEWLDLADEELQSHALSLEELLSGLRRQIRSSTKKTRGLSRSTLALRDAILATFETVDKPVTVRQMFYLLSTRSAVEKTEAGYRQAQRQLLAMRREDLIPYGWIADNTRWQRKPTTWDSLGEFFEVQAEWYRQALWAKAPVYVEVWCEKDAISSVLYNVTSVYDVPLMVARGYSSESFAYIAAEAMRDIGKPAYVYYVGDFDPSGWHMSEDLEKRLRGFGAEFRFSRLTVNPEQVSAWNLPARPTKNTDTRSKDFYRRFGAGCQSVEVDAVHPDQLRALVRDAIEQHIDSHLLDAVNMEERLAKNVLQELAERGLQ